MAEKYLKVIQNGVSSFIPDNRRNRDFWAKQNVRVSRSRSANQETVTLFEASPDEVMFMQQSGSKHNSAPQSAELEDLKKLVAAQQEQIAKLISAVGSEDDVQERGKPGRKPKND